MVLSALQAMLRNQEFLGPFTKIVIPISVQNLFISSLAIVDTMMVGQLGSVSVASVSLANQIFFLLNFTLFGINTGAAVFTAQYWGNRDISGIHRVLGISLIIGIISGLSFSVIAIFFPFQAMKIYTSDPEVIQLGGQYLFISGFGYLSATLTLCYTTVLRSVSRIKAPVLIGIFTLCLNTGLNYLLIFGKYGFPELGVVGAAISTVIARLIECAVLLIYVYAARTPLAASIKKLLQIDRKFLSVYLSVAVPVLLNEIFWALGSSLYQAIYARIGTNQVAAVSIANTILTLASVLFVGITSACGIMVGNSIGEGKPEKAFQVAKNSLILSSGIFVVVAVAILLLRDVALDVFQLTSAGREDAYNVLTVMSVGAIFRAINPIVIVGTLRSGGDTRFSAILDVAAVWCVGVPLAYLGAFVLHLPIQWVVACAYGEGVFKMIWGLHRIASKKWIRNLAI